MSVSYIVLKTAPMLFSSFLHVFLGLHSRRLRSVLLVVVRKVAKKLSGPQVSQFLPSEEVLLHVVEVVVRIRVAYNLLNVFWGPLYAVLGIHRELRPQEQRGNGAANDSKSQKLSCAMHRPTFLHCKNRFTGLASPPSVSR